MTRIVIYSSAFSFSGSYFLRIPEIGQQFMEYLADVPVAFNGFLQGLEHLFHGLPIVGFLYILQKKSKEFQRFS